MLIYNIISPNHKEQQRDQQLLKMSEWNFQQELKMKG